MADKRVYDQGKAPVPEDLRRMAAEIVRVEAACIEIELAVEQLMILRTAAQAFAAERIALAESKLAEAERRERGMRQELNGIAHMLAGASVGHYGYYTAKKIVISPEHEARICAALAQERGEDTGKARGAK